MEFIYNYAPAIKGQKELIAINSAAKRLFDKLRSLKIKELDISDYNKSRLELRVGDLTKSLQLYSYILLLSFAKNDIPISKFVFLEYGGGAGLLSLLAKELGIGIVIYNDIYNVSCCDAKHIAESIGNEADFYVNGDIDDVLDLLSKSNINCNAIASWDVIEHIYDIDSFLSKVSYLSNGPLTVVMSSGANTFNPFIRRKLIKIQLRFEHKERKKEWGHKERDSFKSFFKARREIIFKYLLELDEKLTEEEIVQLTRNTRGMIEADIKKCVDNFMKTGRLPSEPSHPTNTCDPYTGNWCEHLMNQNDLASILSKNGFKVRILSGYYGSSKSIIKRCLGRFLNPAIYIFKKQGIRIAPFYTVCGRRDLNYSERFK